MRELRVQVTTLMYHDVLERPAVASGSLAGASPYELPARDFEQHLWAIAGACLDGSPPARVRDRDDLVPPARCPLLLTFDDGLASSLAIARRLERFGWRGHFFVPTSLLGRSGFLDAAGVRAIHARGHVIGSHSVTHPPRLSSFTRARILREWSDSVAALEDLCGARVRTASVPQGYSSPQVEEAAAEAGIEVLFTSEPRRDARFVDGCVVLGRYTIRRGMPPSVPAGLAQRRYLPALSQSLRWSATEIMKRVGGDHYLTVRDALLRLTG